MSTQRPENAAAELDPEAAAEEHEADGEPTPEEYEPEPELVSATREADAADVAEQLTEVPGMTEDEPADGAED